MLLYEWDAYRKNPHTTAQTRNPPVVFPLALRSWECFFFFFKSHIHTCIPFQYVGVSRLSREHLFLSQAQILIRYWDWRGDGDGDSVLRLWNVWPVWGIKRWRINVFLMCSDACFFFKPRMAQMSTYCCWPTPDVCHVSHAEEACSHRGSYAHWHLERSGFLQVHASRGRQRTAQYQPTLLQTLPEHHW